MADEVVLLKQLIDQIREQDATGDMARGVLGSFLAKFAGAVLALGVQILLARALGLSAFGTYSFVLTWIVIIAASARMGLDSMMLRFVAAHEETGESGLLLGVLRFGHTLAVCSGAIAAGAMVVALVVVRDQLAADIYDGFIAAAPLLFLLSLLGVSQAALRALGRVAASVASEFVLLPLALGSLLGAYYLWSPSRPNAADALYLHAAAALGVLGVVFVWLRRAVKPMKLSNVAPQYTRRQWMSVALPGLFLTSVAYLNAQTDLLMLGILSNTDDVGLYTAAARFAGLALWGLFAINAVMAPAVARLHARGDYQTMRERMAQAAAGIAIITIPLAIGIIVLRPFLLGLFGPQYGEAQTALTLLVVGHTINALSGPVSYLLTMTGHQREAALGIAFAATLNIVLNAVMIPTWGLAGAAAATAITTLAWNLLLLSRVRTHLGVDPTTLAAIRLLLVHRRNHNAPDQDE